MVKSEFAHEVFDAKKYWFARSTPPAKTKSPIVHLLPNYDEYFIGFRDRSAIGDVVRRYSVSLNYAAFIAHIITIDGQLVGGWKRTLKKEAVVIELILITDLTTNEQQAVDSAVENFGKFLGLSVQVIQQNKRSKYEIRSKDH